MKGVIYLIEIAISAVLITIVLSFFLTVQGGRVGFERTDLISTGNNILVSLENNNKLDDLLRNDTGDIKPLNIDFSVSFVTRTREWNLNTPATNKETVSVSTFTNACCDMNETVEIILTLWYRF
jgi:hypothetical protein